MEPSYSGKSIRSFIGANDYEQSRSFYRDLGYTERVLSDVMSVFAIPGGHFFYLQKAYVRDWVDNSMIFLEVDDLEACHADISARKLPEKYKGVRLSGIRHDTWGSEFFLHDPSGILWHFGTFSKS